MTQKTNRRRFKFSWTTSLLCGVLALAMLRASYWQWTRHLEKKVLIEKLESRLQESVLTQEEFSNTSDWASVIHRKVKLKGSFDYENEVLLRNRRHEGTPGFYVISPFKLDGKESRILVNRGFIPADQSAKDLRSKFRNLRSPVEFYGFIKNSMTRRFLAPQDPAVGQDKPWLDEWLRINIPKMEQQLPYKLFPVYVEFISTDSPEISLEQIVKSDVGKTDILYLPERASTLKAKQKATSYPVPQVNTYVPAGRHFGYVFEWAIMALITVLIGLIAQLRRS